MPDNRPALGTRMLIYRKYKMLIYRKYKMLIYWKYLDI